MKTSIKPMADIAANYLNKQSDKLKKDIYAKIQQAGGTVLHYYYVISEHRGIVTYRNSKGEFWSASITLEDGLLPFMTKSDNAKEAEKQHNKLSGYINYPAGVPTKYGFSNVDEIKQAIRDGKEVFWRSSLYNCVLDIHGEYFIVCESNQFAIGLTSKSGILNGHINDFYTL